MRSFSSRLLFSALLISLAACSFKRDENDRSFLGALDSDALMRKLPVRDETNLLAELYEPAAGTGACAWLDTLGTASANSEKFRLLADWQVPGEEQQKVQISDVSGSVDIAASPLYQYALLTQEIPDRGEFMALLDQEYQKATTFGDTFKIGLVRTLIDIGLVNAYNLRNKIIQQKMDEALPGSFAEQETKNIFLDSIPSAVFQNGNPGLIRLNIGAEEPKSVKDKKLADLRSTLAKYRRPNRLFSDGGWQAFSRDMKIGLSAAIRSLRSTDVREYACATTIFHRSFAQLLTVMGFPRLPVQQLESGRSTLPDFKDMLVHPETEELLACGSPGSFLKAGRRVLLTRDNIASAGTGPNPEFLLSKKPFVPAECHREMSEPLSQINFTSDLSSNQVATATELLSFLGGVVNFMSAFNPGAEWWSSPDNRLGFPLSPFESMEKIKSSGAILPTDSHALALGYLNLSFDVLLKKHLVYVGADGREVLNSADATGVRVSDAPRTPGSKAKIKTTIRSVQELTETAFKLGHYLGRAGVWRRNAEDSLRADLASEPDARKRLSLQKDYREFIEGMFGSQDVLQKLTDTGAAGLAAQIRDLKLVMSLLSVAFAQRLPNKKIGCFKESLLDPVTGKETFSGTCTAEEVKTWKYSVRLAARAFRSPVLQEIADSP